MISNSDSSSSSSSDESSGKSNRGKLLPERQLPEQTAAPDQASGTRKRKSSSHQEKSKRKRRREETDYLISSLTTQVNEMQHFLAQNFCVLNNNNDVNNVPDNESIVSLNVSGELFNNDNEVTATNLQDFSVTVNTVLKEPAIEKTDAVGLERLKSLQHFDEDSWTDVRYADVQKKYCSTPGYCELDCNEELKPYDRFTNLSLTERGFAAITRGLIKQHEAVEKGFKSFLTWIRSSDSFNVSAVGEKLKEIFAEGDFQKISNDLLQMACGHRSDLVQQRRDAILRSVKDKFVKASLRKINPSCDSLFSNDKMSAALEKHGGTGKIFWPAKAQNSGSKTIAATQASNSQSHSRTKQPAQGLQNVPFNHGIRYPPPAHGVPFYPFQHTQGSYNVYPHLQNQPFMPNFNRMPAQGLNFRPRAPGPPNASQRDNRQGSSRKYQTKRKY